MSDGANSERNSTNTRAVLVVDDNELVLKMVVSTLAREGFNVLSATSGPEAIAIARENIHVHCLLQDLSMPDMNGEEVIEAILQIRPGLSVVVYSADEEKTVAHRLNHLGIAGYFEKPFEPKVLITKLRELVSN